MTALALRVPDDGDDLTAMDRAELVRLFSDCFGITVAALVRAAAIQAEWLRRGWELDDLAKVAGKWLHRLRLIHSGQLLPELAFRFYGQPGRLDGFARLPVDDQRRIIDDVPLPVVVKVEGNAVTDVRTVPPSALVLAPGQFKQVFALDHIRDQREQVLWLEDQQRKAQRAGPARAGELTIDYVQQGAKCGNRFIPLCDLLTAVRELKKGRS